MINFAVWCMEFRPSKFFMTVSCIDIIFYTLSIFIMTTSSPTSFSKDPLQFLLILLHLIFFLAVSFCIFWYWKKSRFNTIWHKLYAVLRLTHSLVLFIILGVIDVKNIMIAASNDITVDKQETIGEIFLYLFFILLSIYNLYLTYFYLKLSFMRSMKTKRVVQSLL